jgi:hypothetical protein
LDATDISGVTIGQFDVAYGLSPATSIGRSSIAAAGVLSELTFDWQKTVTLDGFTDPIDEYGYEGSGHGLVVIRKAGATVNDNEMYVRRDPVYQLLELTVSFGTESCNIFVEPAMFFNFMTDSDYRLITGNSEYDEDATRRVVWSLLQCSISSKRVSGLLYETLGSLNRFRVRIAGPGSFDEASDCGAIKKYRNPSSFAWITVIAGKGSGKTTLTRQLELDSIPYIDSDELWEGYGVYSKFAEKVEGLDLPPVDVILSPGFVPSSVFTILWDSVYHDFIVNIFDTVMEVAERKGIGGRDRCIVFLTSPSELRCGRLCGRKFFLNSFRAHRTVNNVYNRTLRWLDDDPSELFTRYNIQDIDRIVQLEVLLAKFTAGLVDSTSHFDCGGTCADIYLRLRYLCRVPIRIDALTSTFFDVPEEDETPEGPMTWIPDNSEYIDQIHKCFTSNSGN